MQKHHHGICVFCGSEGNVSDDHVPPQNIFPKPRDNKIGLIKVPGCSRCNQGSSVDDEAFKLFVSLKAGMDSGPAQKLHETTRRTVEKNLRLKRELSKNVTRFYLPANLPGGFAETSIVRYESAPVRRVLRKTVLGLYYHHFGDIICNDVDVSILLADQIEHSKADELRMHVAEIAANSNHGSIGVDQEFYYRYALAADAKNASAWIFAFYQRAGVIAHTIPKGKA